jgi:hypothetical protein
MKRFKQFLNESKQVGDLYHFTDVEGALGILDHDTIYASVINDPPAVSTTRDKNFHKMSRIITDRDGRKKQVRGGVNTDVSFVLDGNKLSNKKKIKPFSYLSFSKAYNRSSEKEEQVHGDIDNVKKFIKKIRIHGDITPNEEERIKKHNIEIEKIK